MKGNEGASNPPAEGCDAVDAWPSFSRGGAAAARVSGRIVALVVLALLWARCYAGGLRVRLLVSEYLLLALSAAFLVVLSVYGAEILRRPARAFRRAPPWILALLLANISYLALWKVSQITATWGFGLGILCVIHVLLRRFRSESALNETAGAFLGGFWFAAGAFLPGFVADGNYSGYVHTALCAGAGFGMAFLRMRKTPQAPSGGAPPWLAHPALWLSGGLVWAGWLMATETSGSTRFLYTLAAGMLILLLILEIFRARGMRLPEPWIWASLGLPALVSVPWLGP
ncbi:MAG TPA: hypothetical protein VMN36_11175 [Verrucomicrobiales bacterium]|nr:hypothetical protein [Verrucomicrobiales bacterium]